MPKINLTNLDKDPVHGDEILETQGNLKIYYTHAEDSRSKEELAREWRNQELLVSDWIMSVSDHSQLDAYKTYRTKLRDWPNTSDFPDTKPTL